MDPLFHRLDLLLAQKRMTKTQLSDKSGISVHTLRGYWHNNRVPGGQELVALASTLETTAEYLISGQHPHFYAKNKVLRDIVNLLGGVKSAELREIRGLIRGHLSSEFHEDSEDE